MECDGMEMCGVGRRAAGSVGGGGGEWETTGSSGGVGGECWLGDLLTRLRLYLLPSPACGSVAGAVVRCSAASTENCVATTPPPPHCPLPHIPTPRCPPFKRRSSTLNHPYGATETPLLTTARRWAAPETSALSPYQLLSHSQTTLNRTLCNTAKHSRVLHF